jgi:hypothetical protein
LIQNCWDDLPSQTWKKKLYQILIFWWHITNNWKCNHLTTDQCYDLLNKPSATAWGLIIHKVQLFNCAVFCLL